MTQRIRRNSLENITRSNSGSELIRTYSQTGVNKNQEKIRKNQDIRKFFHKTGKELVQAPAEVLGIEKTRELRSSTSLPELNSSVSLGGSLDSVFDKEEPSTQTIMDTTSPQSQRSSKKRPTMSATGESPQKKDQRVETAGETMERLERKIFEMEKGMQALMVIKETHTKELIEIQKAQMGFREDRIADKVEVDTSIRLLQGEVAQLTEKTSALEAEFEKHKKAISMLDKESGTNVVGALSIMNAMKEEVENQKTTIATMEALLKNMKGEKMQKSGKGIYIAGLDRLRAQLGLHDKTHPIQVCKTLLWYAFGNSLGQYESIRLLDRTKHWSQINTAMIYFYSPQNKKDAEIMFKQYFQKEKIQGVMIRDIFPQEKIQEAKDLAKKGAIMRENGKVMRYRVMNRNGEPILQVLYTGGRGYQDLKVHENEEEMEEGGEGYASGANKTPLGPSKELKQLRYNDKVPTDGYDKEKTQQDQKDKTENQQQGGGTKSKENSNPNIRLKKIIPTDSVNNSATTSRDQSRDQSPDNSGKQKGDQSKTKNTANMEDYNGTRSSGNMEDNQGGQQKSPNGGGGATGGGGPNIRPWLQGGWNFMKGQKN